LQASSFIHHVLSASIRQIITGPILAATASICFLAISTIMAAVAATIVVDGRFVSISMMLISAALHIIVVSSDDGREVEVTTRRRLRCAFVAS
jgi:hypothetical protein